MGSLRGFASEELCPAFTHGFAHLHVRSGFSYGFGVATPEELIEAAAGMGTGALALTDRDGLYGVPRFLASCAERGLSPIVGAEVSMEGGGHLVLLAKSAAGYRSLCRLVTSYRLSSEDRRKPSCPFPTILEHSEGLVCLTGAVPSGYVARRVLAGGAGVREAAGALAALREAFGEDLYVELSDDRTAGSRRRLRRIKAFAAEHGVAVVATNEVAYLRPEDHRLHEVLVAASNLSRLPGPGYRPTDQFWLKPPGMMRALFEDYPEALQNAATVAQRCAGVVRLSGTVHMPAALLPAGRTATGRLARLALAGARRRYGRPDAQVKSRLRRELSCIENLGYAPYFLIAHEAKGIARARGVPVTGRGSAANSMVAYCLGLTSPEPLSNRLLFERFLHERREDPPDIDLDLDSEKRDEVRDELMGRYERSGVGAAVAATAGTMSLRGAVRVAARALGYVPAEIDRLSRHVPARFRDRDRVYVGLAGWEEALREPAMRGHPLQDREEHRLLLELSARLCGRLWQAGTHNGGVVFGNGCSHLSELVPLEPSGRQGLVRCQYDKDDLEYVGLPKLDLLGLKMHTALRKAGELASARAPLGEEVDPYALPAGDKATYALIRTGKNAGMFQLESPGQMSLSTRLKPRRFSDLVAQISLFRPGPVRGDLVTPYVRRRNGQEPYSVPLPELDEVLRPTYGVMVFQEQVLAICNRVAGFSLAEGDLVRRAMTRARGPGAMQGLRERFVGSAVERGAPKGKAEEVFEWMEGFSVYGFSAAHGASFAELAYASAYMRTHYPAEFFAALLNSQPMGFYSPRVLLNEARRIGLSVLPPNIHQSGEGFRVEEDGTALRVGLSYCKGLSEKASASIVSERRKKPFASAIDLYQRTAVERDSLEMLIGAGFLDALADRGRLVGEAGRLPKKRKRKGQAEIPLEHPASWWAAREGRSFVGGGDAPLGLLPLAESAREQVEWEALGINVSRHPLSPYRRALGELGVVPSVEVLSLPHGTRTRAAGLLESLQRPPTRSGRPVYFLLVEDEHGLLQCTIFESAYRQCGHVLHQAGAFLIEGRVEQDRRRGFLFIVSRVRNLYEVLEAGERAPEPRTVSSSGAFIRAGKRKGRKAM